MGGRHTPHGGLDESPCSTSSSLTSVRDGAGDVLETQLVLFAIVLCLLLFVEQVIQPLVDASLGIIHTQSMLNTFRQMIVRLCTQSVPAFV